MNINEQELNLLLESNPSLRGMVMGYVAEIKLKQKWFMTEKIDNIYKPDDHNKNIKADLVIEYNNKEYTIEVKSIKTNSIEKISDSNFKGKFQCDASDKRLITLNNNKSIKTSCLKKGCFDILAINLYPFTGEWEFAFINNKDLPTTNYPKYDSEIQDQLLKTTINISYPFEKPFYDNPYKVIKNMS